MRISDWSSDVCSSDLQYRRLAEFILDSFDLPPDKMARPISGHFEIDVFHEARGDYNLFTTSNEWTGAALRATGVRIGIWTPFAQSVLMRFPIENPGGGT